MLYLLCILSSQWLIPLPGAHLKPREGSVLCQHHGMGWMRPAPWRGRQDLQQGQE